MLILRPAGRGNWATATLKIDSSRAQPLLVKVGDRFPIAGVVWRVVEVRP